MALRNCCRCVFGPSVVVALLLCSVGLSVTGCDVSQRDIEGGDEPAVDGSDGAQEPLAASNGDEEPLAERIPPGEVAMQLRLPADAGGGAVERGDRIDLIGIFKTDEQGDLVTDPSQVGGGQPVMFSFLQNISVLDAGVISAGDRQVELILSLTPDEHEFVQGLRRIAEISVALRGFEDIEIHPVNRLPVAERLDDASRIVEQRPRPLERPVEACLGSDGRQEQRSCIVEAVSNTDKGRLSDNIGTGQRAVTVPISAAAARAPRAGDRVDIMAVLAADDTGELLIGDAEDRLFDYRSVDLVLNAVVLASGIDPAYAVPNRGGSDRQSPRQQGVDRKLLTLLVTVQEAHLLRIGSHAGTLHASIRDLEDFRPHSAESTTLHRVLADLRMIANRRQQRTEDGARAQPADATSEFTGLDGHRAATISADAFVEDSLWPHEGQRIDITATFGLDTDGEIAGPGQEVADYKLMTLLQHVVVLDQHPGGITVAVTPEEVHLLHLVATVGQLGLGLRGRLDDRLDFVYAVPDSLSEKLELMFCPDCFDDSPQEPPCPPNQRLDGRGECVAEIEIIR